MSYLNPARYYNPRGKLLYSASRIPRFSPVVANLMLNLAVQDTTRPIDIIDPFVGNGVILCVARLNFSDKINTLFGSDIDPHAAITAKMNVDLYNDSKKLEARVREVQAHNPKDNSLFHESNTLFRYISCLSPLSTRIEINNALTMKYPPSTAKQVIVTDPPYGNACNWTSESGVETSESRMTAFLNNALKQSITKMVLSFDNEQNLVNLLKNYFVVKETKLLRGRSVYLVYAKK